MLRGNQASTAKFRHNRIIGHAGWPAYAGIAFVFEFEMQINDDTQYRGKEAPHGKKATV
jgi:hypothetical protein